jgi:hypothetical protein
VRESTSGDFEKIWVLRGRREGTKMKGESGFSWKLVIFLKGERGCA